MAEPHKNDAKELIMPTVTSRKSTVVALVSTFVLGAVFLMAAKEYLDIPTVYVSNSTKECVKVLPEGDCYNLPEKYRRVWVE